MIPAVRKQKIMEEVKGKDIVYIEDLLQSLDISFSTLRRDLKELEVKGQINMLRGGAVQIRQKSIELCVTDKFQLNRDLKERIASKAAEFVEDGDVIFMDPSSTANMMIKYLVNKKITVVTNSIVNINELAISNIPIIVIGGDLKTVTNSCIGPLAEASMKELRFNKCFLGANGMTTAYGVTNHDVREKTLKRVAIENSIDSYFVIDSTKFGTVTMSKVADFDECYIITDKYFPDFEPYENVILCDSKDSSKENSNEING